METSLNLFYLQYMSKEGLKHLCVGENVQNLGSVSLAFAFSSCLGFSGCHSSVGTEMKSSTSTCKILQVDLDTVQGLIDLGLNSVGHMKKKCISFISTEKPSLCSHLSFS